MLFRSDCAYVHDFAKQKIVFPAIMSKSPAFAFDTSGKYVLAPGNIIVGDISEEMALYLNTVGYFALKKYYMGGGIEGELKVNRLQLLPLPKDVRSLKSLDSLFNYFDFSKEESEVVIDYLERT